MKLNLNASVFLFLSSGVAFALAKEVEASSNLRALRAQEFCSGENPLRIVSATAKDSSGLNSAFENFRDILGGDNNGNNVDLQYGGFQEGHRQVNWDAGIVPFDMPGDFFAATVTRGMEVSSSSNEFRVSNPSEGGDNLFDSIKRSASKDFQTFSPERLFTPVNENVFKVNFSVPGNVNERATVDGFGAVFVDVDRRYKTKMTYYAESGCIIAEEYVESSRSGLSFLGIKSTKIPIYSVEVTLGKRVINSSRWFGDIVVMDDFLYSEPQSVINAAILTLQP